MGRCDAAKVGMCVLKDVQVLSLLLLLLLDFSRVRNGRQPAEYGWEELSDSRCSVILRCGSVCAYEYASTISLAFGRWSSYCSAGRKERVARSKQRQALTYSKSQMHLQLQFARGGAGRKASLPVLSQAAQFCFCCHLSLHLCMSSY